MTYYYVRSFIIFIDFLICKLKKKSYGAVESLITILIIALDIAFATHLTFLKQQTLSQILADLGESTRFFKFDMGFYYSQLLLFLNFNFLTSWPVLDYVLTFLIVDFCYYWVHRFYHEVGIGWAQHSVHHSIVSLNILSGHRNYLTILNIGLITAVFLLPAPLGISVGQMFSIIAIIRYYQVLVHSEWFPRLWRPLELIFHTPWHHRLHHSIVDTTHFGNYSGVFIFYDRIFGTLIEKKDSHHVYGLKDIKPHNNLFRLHTQVWWQLIQKIKNSNSFFAAFKILFIPQNKL